MTNQRKAKTESGKRTRRTNSPPTPIVQSPGSFPDDSGAEKEPINKFNMVPATLADGSLASTQPADPQTKIGEDEQGINAGIALSAVSNSTGEQASIATRTRKKPLELLKKKEHDRHKDKLNPLQQLKQIRPNPTAPLATAARTLEAAIRKSLVAFKDEGDFDACCDEYTRAARHFAELITAERIRRIFSQKIDWTTGKSLESLEEKKKTAQLVREILSPWNLGFFREGDKSGIYQIFATDNNSEDGVYRLKLYGKKESFTASDEIRKTVEFPVLGDASCFDNRPNLLGPSR